MAELGSCIFHVLVKSFTNQVSDDCGTSDSIILASLDHQPKNDQMSKAIHHTIIIRIKKVPFFMIMNL
jgi:hypothetical protein